MTLATSQSANTGDTPSDLAAKRRAHWPFLIKMQAIYDERKRKYGTTMPNKIIPERRSAAITWDPASLAVIAAAAAEEAHGSAAATKKSTDLEKKDTLTEAEVSSTTVAADQEAMDWEPSPRVDQDSDTIVQSTDTEVDMSGCSMDQDDDMPDQM